MKLHSFERGAGTDAVSEALQRDGGAIALDWISQATADAVAAELRPYFDSEGEDFQSDFNGYRTNRVSGILARSRTAAGLIAHEPMLAVVERILGPHCESFRIGSTTGIEIMPGEGHQVLHRDDSMYPLPHPGPERQVSAMWALTEFTPENGATRLVPGSQHWDDERRPSEDETVIAAMPKGALLLFLGSVYHGGGKNRAGTPRVGLINTYALGWLRQEENQYLTVPREIADGLPEPVRRLMGYRVYGAEGKNGVLGWYPGQPEGT